MSAPEERIGAAVAEWLRAAGWQVYAEVQVPGSKRRADIVATRPATLDRVQSDVLIVEAKTRLTWDLLGQAADWRGWANFVTVATATGPKGRGFDAAVVALRGRGFGWLVVLDDGVHQLLAPTPDVVALRRAGIVLDALRPEHTTSRPGTASGEHYTATQERDARLRAHVAAHPGVELRQACDALGLRLDADGRRALARHVRCALDGVTAQRDGRRLLLWPAERTGF